MARRRGGDSSSTSTDSSSHPNSSTLSSASSSRPTKDLSLGLSISTCRPNSNSSCCREREEYPSSSPWDWPPIKPLLRWAPAEGSAADAALFVKVYMEGIPVGRKLNLLTQCGYHDLIRTLDLMFNTTIIWAELAADHELHAQKFHVLTYEDKEEDWMMVGDVPWEMFLRTVKRLKISRIRK